MVAKSYASLEQIGEPYESNGKMYIKVRTKTGNEKAVRYYTEREYLKLYPGETIDHSNDPYYKPQKEVLGFTNGYITIFKGNTYENREYFQLSKARYARNWGWYFISTEPLPDDIPEDVTPIQLPWELVGNEDGKLKSEEEVKMAVENLLYGDDTSEFQGTIGEKIAATLTVVRAVPLDGYYGPSTMHIMRDAENNCYTWTTAAKSWEEGSTHTITGTVKDHSIYKGVKQTVLTRCKEK